MALDGTYAGLQASVADFLNRTDLNATIPDFIKLAEAELNRTIRCAEMVNSTTLTVNSASVALPADFAGVVSLELPSGNGAMQYDKPDGIRAHRLLYPSSGTPLKWTVSGLNVETSPTPSGSFACTLLYYQRIPALTNSNTSNWLLTKNPDAYLYGALLQAAPYLKDDARIQAWGLLYQKAIDTINSNDGRVSFGHGFTPPFRNAAAPPGTDPQPPSLAALAAAGAPGQ